MTKFAEGDVVSRVTGGPLMTALPDLHDLRHTLTVMKSANKKGVNMNIWDRDIAAVESAIAAIEAFGDAGTLLAPLPTRS